MTGGTGGPRRNCQLALESPAQSAEPVAAQMQIGLRLRVWLGLLLLWGGQAGAAPADLTYDRPPDPALSHFATVVVAGEGVWQQAKQSDVWRPVKNGDRLPVGSLLLTDTSSAAVVELPETQGVVNVARGSVVEFARLKGRPGNLRVLTSGRVAGVVNDSALEISSSCGGSLSVTAAPGGTAPFEFRHGRDQRHFAELERLGLVSDWVRFQPRAGDNYQLGFGPIPPPPEPEHFALTFETWTLLALVSAALGVFLWQRD